jgi:hypothetical protein
VAVLRLFSLLQWKRVLKNHLDEPVFKNRDAITWLVGVEVLL